MSAIDDLIATMNAHHAALHVELDAYRAWHDEQGIAIVPRPELLAALQDIIALGKECEEFVRNPREADALRLFAIVQRIGHDVIWWTGRLREEREALRKGLH